MKTFLKRHMIGLFALVLTVTTMSFKMTNNSTTWYYANESVADGAFATVGNWTQGTSPHSCQDEGAKPCEIVTDNIAAALSGRDNAAVLAISTQRD